MDNAQGITSESPISDKVIYGLRIALRKMAEEAALHDESLAIGYKDGTCELIPAKQLLDMLPK
jgi:hypothetical protein